MLPQRKGIGFHIRAKALPRAGRSREEWPSRLMFTETSGEKHLRESLTSSQYGTETNCVTDCFSVAPLIQDTEALQFRHQLLLVPAADIADLIMQLHVLLRRPDLSSHYLPWNLEHPPGKFPDISADSACSVFPPSNCKIQTCQVGARTLRLSGMWENLASKEAVYVRFTNNSIICGAAGEDLGPVSDFAGIAVLLKETSVP